MYYCMRCGDKIDKDEFVCDKCGLKFTVTKEDGSMVYVNMSPKQETENGQSKKRIKKKSKSKGWIIALVTTVSAMFLLFVGTAVLSAGGLVGGLFFLLAYDDDIEVYDPTVDPLTSDVAMVKDPIVFQNDGQAVQSQYFADVLRDPFVTLKGDGTDTVTVMMYMNGSDLESEYGYASSDLREILSATLSDNVNVIIQTGGTKRWASSSISSKHSQRFIVQNGQLVLIDNTLDQLDITKEETLEDFITFCNTNYPADRNMLILWNHGGGVVYGYGSDENIDYDGSLTIGEIQKAARDSGVKFEMIGFDACLMGGLETACALCDVADYLVASEDFESGDGWEYQNWLSLLGYNSSTTMQDLGKVIVDDFILESQLCNCDGVLSLTDLRYSRLLFNAWTDFAYANESELLEYDYSMSMERSQRALPSMFKDDDKDIFDWLFGPSYTMETYCYAVDLMAVANKMNTEESKALASALACAIQYASTTQGDSYMTGLSVTIPYSDEEFYANLCDVFYECGFDSNYVGFLGQFVDADYYGSYNWDESGYCGWDDYDSDEYYYDWDEYEWDDYTSCEYDWDDYDYDDEWYESDYDFGDYYYDPEEEEWYYCDEYGNWYRDGEWSNFDEDWWDEDWWE